MGEWGALSSQVESICRVNHTVSAFIPQKFSGKVWLWHQHQTKCSCSVFPDHFLKKVQKLHAVILMTSLHICKQEHSPNPGIVPDVAVIRSDCSPWFHRACRILFQKLLKLALRHFWGEAVVICRSVLKSVLLMWETFHDSHPCYLLQPPGTSNLWSHQHHLNYILLKNIQFQTTADTNWSSVGPSNIRVNWFGATGLQILRLQSLEGLKITVKCSQSTFLWVSLRWWDSPAAHQWCDSVQVTHLSSLCSGCIHTWKQGFSFFEVVAWYWK